MYEGDDLNTLEDDAQPPEESGNKTFLLVAAILGGIVLLSIACLVVYGFYWIPRQSAERDAQQATLIAQNLQVDLALTDESVAARCFQAFKDADYRLSFLHPEESASQ